MKSNLNEISRGKFKLEQQKMTVKNVKLIYESREAVLTLFDIYSSIVSQAKHKVKYGKRLKILTPK